MNAYSKDLKLCRSANEDIHEKVNAVEVRILCLNLTFLFVKDF